MKDSPIQRNYGPEPLVVKRGLKRVYVELLDKALQPSDLERVKETEEFHVPCSSVVHRFGKRFGST